MITLIWSIGIRSSLRQSIKVDWIESILISSNYQVLMTAGFEYGSNFSLHSATSELKTPENSTRIWGFVSI